MLHRHLAATTALLLAAGVAAHAATLNPAVAGPPAKTTTTARAQAEPEYGRLMLLLDSSGSMAEDADGGQTKIQAAKSALNSVIDELPDEAQVGMRVFGSKVFSRNDPGACEDTELVVEPGTDNRDELHTAVAAYEPYGETPIPIALQETANDLGDEGARSIVLVSDGESTCGDPCDVARQISGQDINLQIDVVGLSVNSAARQQLECIAREGHGTYYDADSAEDIEVHVTGVAERALRPFALTGEPIEGGPEDAPTPITAGDWTDRLEGGGESKSYAFERTTAGTTIRVAAITQGERGTSEFLTTEIYDAEGNRCDYHNIQRPLDTRSILGAGATASTEEECDQPGQYRITVSRGQNSGERVAFGLRVTEEPAVTDPGFAADGEVEVAEPTVSGQPEEIVGGASFDNAAEIGPGSWSGTVVPGEAPLFALPLDFGQSARISVEFPELSPSLEDIVGNDPPLARLTLYSPMHAQIPYADGSTFSARAAGETLMTATVPVSRTPVDLDASFNGGGDYTTSGSYYLGVAVNKEDYSTELPFTVNVEIVGEPADGPTYADGATWSVEDGLSDDGDGEPETDGPTDASGSDDDTTSSPAEDSDDDSGSGSGQTVALVAGVVGLAVLLGAFLLWRRRPAGPTPGGGE